MKRADFLRLLDEFFELGPGTLTGTEILRDLPGWDSLKLVELIALVDEHLSISVQPDKLVKNNSVNDLMTLLGEGIQP